MITPLNEIDQLYFSVSVYGLGQNEKTYQKYLTDKCEDFCRDRKITPDDFYRCVLQSLDEVQERINIKAVYGFPGLHISSIFPYITGDISITESILEKIRAAVNEITGKAKASVSVNIKHEFQNLYYEKLKAATGGTGVFDKLIVCAAFCDLLWDNNYYEISKYEAGKRIEVSNAFALQNNWFDDIRNQLKGTTKKARNLHKGILKTKCLFTKCNLQ